MLALVCRTILLTNTLICGSPMSEQDAKEALLSQWRPAWLSATMDQSEPFVVQETDQGWQSAFAASRTDERTLRPEPNCIDRGDQPGGTSREQTEMDWFACVARVFKNNPYVVFGAPIRGN